jgi:hypothetical protein
MANRRNRKFAELKMFCCRRKEKDVPLPIPSLVEPLTEVSENETNGLKGEQLYDYLKTKIQPLDLIAFRGGDLVSDVITLLEKHSVGFGDFSHVGVVVTSAILPSYLKDDGTEFTLEDDVLYVMESTFSHDIGKIVDGGGDDVIKEKGYFGVQLRELREVVRRYISSKKTKVAWCPLLDNPFDESGARGIVRKLFMGLFEKYYGTKYDLDMVDLLASMFPVLREAREVKDAIENKFFKLVSLFKEVDEKNCPSGWQFCSELVANIYQGLGILDKKIDTRNVLPVDFFGDDKDQDVPRLVDTPVYFEGW